MIEGDLEVEKFIFEEASNPIDWKVTVRPDAPATKEI